MPEECLVCSNEIETLGCGLTAGELDKMRTFAKSLHIRKKGVFAREGEPQDYYYQIFHGVAGTYNFLPDGKRIITEILFAGDFIGPQPGGVYPFTAESLQDVYLCAFEKRKMDQLIAESPTLKDKLNMFQQEGLNKARAHLLNVSHRAPLEKVASFLLFICSNMEPEGKTFIIPMGRAEVGDYVGLTSETVSRAITEMAEQGIISMETPSRVSIEDAPKLFKLVNGEDFSPGSPEFKEFAARLGC